MPGVLRRAPPLAVKRRRRTLKLSMSTKRYYGVIGIGLIVIATSGVVVSMRAAGQPRVSVGQADTVRPQSWLSRASIVTVYGRGFGIAPILGRLGIDKNFDDVAHQVRPFSRAIMASNGTRHVRIAIHIIYGLATSCRAPTACLSYLDDAGTDIRKKYIEPAAKRGWLVILDDQLGRSNPRYEVLRMMRKGYLRYDNVGVAFDPEFRMSRDQITPGTPVGRVSAGELNQAQHAINQYAVQHRVLHRKLLLVHQWLPEMIVHRRQIRTDFQYVEPVIVMDAIGTPEDKSRSYNSLLGTKTLRTRIVRGIKLFFSSPYEPAGTIDTPVLSWKQIFDRSVSGQNYVPAHLQVTPQVIVIT